MADEIYEIWAGDNWRRVVFDDLRPGDVIRKARWPQDSWGVTSHPYLNKRNVLAVDVEYCVRPEAGDTLEAET